MTDRTVVYRLQADVKQFQAQMAAAGASARKAAGDLGTSLQSGGSKASSALDDLGINAGTAALAVGTTVVMATANFEKAMSGVQAATHESAAGMESLRDAALEAGAQTSFSASEAAAGIENLAKAGVATADILGGGLSGALSLAAAGEMEVADAAEAAAGAMAQFGLSGEQVPHIADLLAASAGKAQGEVSDMVMALKQAGTVSSQTGLSLEETTAGLAALAEQSLLGSDAGTSFKQFLASLTPNSNKAAKAMDALGLSAFDAQGNFVGLAEFAGRMQVALGDMSNEQRMATMETIFGSDAVRAASIIYENGAEGISNWTAEVDDAGYAAETAAIKLDNLKGDVEALKGALETAFIEGGDDSQGMLRGITQLATDTVNLTTEAEKADGALGGLWNSAMGAINPIGSLGDTYKGLKGVISDTDESSKGLDDTSKALTSSTGGLAGATDSVMDAMSRAAEETESFKDMLDRLNEELAGRADMRDYQAAIDDFTKSLKDNGRTFDINTEKGRNNQAALDSIASSALEVAANMGKAQRQKFLTNAIDDIRTMGERMGLPKREVNALIALLREANKTNVKPDVDADTGRAMGSLREVDTYLDGLNGKTATTYVNTVRTVTGPKGAAVFSQHAEGGFITGPGTATSDSIPSYLSNGEYVVKAAAVAKYGVHMFDSLNAMHFAEGGAVTKGDDDKKKPRRKFHGGEFVQDNTAALQRSIDRLSMIAEDQTGAVENQTRVAEEAADEMGRWADKMADVASATTAGFNTGLFERDSNPWAAGANGGPLANITSDIAGLNERANLQTQLSGMGISSDALAAILGQGTNADIASLIASGQAPAVAAAFAERAALQGSVGAAAGQAAYGEQFAAAERNAQAQWAEAQRQTAHLATLEAQILHLNAQITRVEQRLANAPADTGDAVGRVINGAAAGGQRDRVARGGPR